MENDSGGYLKYHFRPYIFKPLDLGHFHVAANKAGISQELVLITTLF